MAVGMPFSLAQNRKGCPVDAAKPWAAG